MLVAYRKSGLNNVLDMGDARVCPTIEVSLSHWMIEGIAGADTKT
jgi:hypothetical protein